jgi:hypothetical protein
MAFHHSSTLTGIRQRVRNADDRKLAGGFLEHAERLRDAQTSWSLTR